MTVQEKLAVIEVARDAADGKVPAIAGIAEFTAFAQNTWRVKRKGRRRRDYGDAGAGLPAKPHETAAHFRSVACATDLPIAVYNNPPIYKMTSRPTS